MKNDKCGKGEQKSKSERSRGRAENASENVQLLYLSGKILTTKNMQYLISTGTSTN